jgi:hypothetical protein
MQAYCCPRLLETELRDVGTSDKSVPISPNRLMLDVKRLGPVSELMHDKYLETKGVEGGRRLPQKNSGIPNSLFSSLYVDSTVQPVTSHRR